MLRFLIVFLVRSALSYGFLYGAVARFSLDTGDHMAYALYAGLAWLIADALMGDDPEKRPREG